MAKRYSVFAVVYAAIAMAFGVFYREFTRARAFTGVTRLSALHTHYFVLGMIFFLILVVLEKQFAFSSQKTVKPFLVFYNAGLNGMAIVFTIKGVNEVLGKTATDFQRGFFSGLGGVSHIFLAVGIILFFVALFKAQKTQV